MKPNVRFWGFSVLIGLVIVVTIIWLFSRPKTAVAPTVTNDANQAAEPTPSDQIPTTKTLQTEIIPDRANQFDFEVEVPIDWQVEAITANESLNFYLPNATGATNLEKSQVFVRHFEASKFLTLSTVDVISTKDLTVAGRPSRQYVIEKKIGAANFPDQPSWRNARHTVTDVRVSDKEPSVFYVIAANPELNPTIYERFLTTLRLTDGQTAKGTPIEPIAEFKSRISKKFFGTYVTPQNSPVQPERFTGYHTAVDVEYADVTGEVPVIAVADGTVVSSQVVDGYGGVILIKHTINGLTYVAVYGHLDPKSLVANNKTVKAGDPIGVLGDGGSSETDGERKHLHFGLVKGGGINLKGYVSTQTELSAWADPLSFY